MQWYSLKGFWRETGSFIIICHVTSKYPIRASVQIVEGPHTRDQITSDGGSKGDSLDCVLCILFILSGCLNECWLRTCHAISHKITRLQLRSSCSEGGVWEREFALLSLPLANEVAVISVGTFRNYDGDGNRNVKNTIGYMMKTTTLPLQHAFLYISLLSLHNYDVKWPNFKSTWEGERQGNKFFSLPLKSDAVPSRQIQPNFPTFK